MSIIESKCKNCGANLEINKEKGEAVCPVCNTSYILESSVNDITNNVSNENHINNSVVNVYESNSVKIENGIYEGESKSGVPHGYGVCIYSNGDRYEGNWLAGARNGQGKYTYSDGNEWFGEWKNNWEWTGKGFVIWNADSVYNGELIDGKANGQGTMTYKDGNQWIGEWKDNQEWNGEGDYVLYDENNEQTGQVYSGKVINGEPQENGEWHFNGYWNKYDIQNDVLVGYYGDEEQLKIPEGVHKVAKRFKLGRYTSVVLPVSLKSISKDNFEGYGGSDIEEIIGYGLESISGDLFSDCYKLKTVKLPNATIIKEGAFSECHNLETVDIPNVTLIEDNAFYECHNLKTINSPNVTVIGEYAFLNCCSLKEFNGPSVIELNYLAFKSCDNLTFINCPKAKVNTSEDYNSKGCKGYYEYLFIGCSKLETIKIEGTTYKIEDIKEDIVKKNESGCYIATCVYGSYDCPPVWTLRRYRDNQLAKTWYGRLFIYTYYAISPTIVKWFGDTKWFKLMWQNKLDKMVEKLQLKGISSSPYEDEKW